MTIVYHNSIRQVAPLNHRTLKCVSYRNKGRNRESRPHFSKQTSRKLRNLLQFDKTSNKSLNTPNVGMKFEIIPVTINTQLSPKISPLKFRTI